jgi:hypothetical protein
MGAEQMKFDDPDQLKMLLWAAWRELNEIRARDGVPWTHMGCKACVDEKYFSRLVDHISAVLGDDAKPWPAKRWLTIPDGTLPLNEDGWCEHCGCGNDGLGYAHLEHCSGGK